MRTLRVFRWVVGSKTAPSMLENISLRIKLWIPPVIGGGALFILLISSLLFGGRVARQLGELEHGQYPSVAFTRELHSQLGRLQLELRDAVSREDPEAIADTVTLRDKFLERVASERDNPVLVSEDLDALATKFATYHSRASAVSLEMLSGIALDEAFSARVATLAEDYRDLNHILVTQATSAETRMTELLATVRAAQDVVTRTTAFVLIVCVTALILLSRKLVVGITSVIAKIETSAAAVAGGDLQGTTGFSHSERINADELGALVRSFIEMRERLRELVDGARMAAEGVAHSGQSLDHAQVELQDATAQQQETMTDVASAVDGVLQAVETIGQSIQCVLAVAAGNLSSIQELEASVTETSRSLDSQAEAVEQVAASTYELGASVQEISGSAQLLNEAAAGAATAVEQLESTSMEVNDRAQDTAREAREFDKRRLDGQRKASSTSAGIGELRNAFDGLVALMNSLGTRLQSAEKINGVIEGIVDETNLLSLNAAIVSAQAGEHGRSFGVVAEAIKVLAKRASQSTQEIRMLLSAVQQDATHALAAVEANSETVDGCVVSCAELVSEFERIGESSIRCLENMQGIDEASQHQSQGLAHVRDAVKHVRIVSEQLERGTGEQAIGTVQVRNAVEEIRGFIQQLRNSATGQRNEARNMAASAANLSMQAEDVSDAINEQRARGAQIREGLSLLSQVRDRNSDVAKSIATEAASLADRTEELSSKLQRFTL